MTEVREWWAMRPRCAYCRTAMDYADGTVCDVCAAVLAKGEVPERVRVASYGCQSPGCDGQPRVPGGYCRRCQKRRSELRNPRAPGTCSCGERISPQRKNCRRCAGLIREAKHREQRDAAMCQV